MPSKKTLVPIEQIENSILFIRGQKVMLDSDLAKLYGVSTRILNQAVKRNINRFPDDFMFKLTQDEKKKVVTNCDHLKKLKFSSVLPNAFTEHGAVMVASLLNSEIAIKVSIQVVRAFIKLRKILQSNKELSRKLNELERKYDAQFRVVFDAIRQLMLPPEPKRKPIGFINDEEKDK